MKEAPHLVLAGRAVAALAAVLLLCTPASAVVSDLTPPAGGVLDFAIVRKGSVIGDYHSEFTGRADRDLEVRTRVKVEVSVGPVRLYSFAHHSVETWRNGKLVALVADTDDDGTVHHLMAQNTDQAMILTVDGKTAMTSGNSVPSSLWSMAMLGNDRPIFDITDGQLFKTTTRCNSAAQSPPVPQETVCEITGDLIRTLRYDPQGILDGVSFLADDGSKVDYRLR